MRREIRLIAALLGKKTHYLAVGVRNHDGFEQPQQMLDYMIDCLQSIAGE